MLVCAANKEIEALTVPNIETDSLGILDNSFDFEQSVLSSAMSLNKETVETKVLQYLSNSNHSIELMGKHPFDIFFFRYNSLLPSSALVERLLYFHRSHPLAQKKYIVR